MWCISLLHFICSLLATGVMFFVLGATFVAALVVIINARDHGAVRVRHHDAECRTSVGGPGESPASTACLDRTGLLTCCC
jgi:hypothetical protein